MTPLMPKRCSVWLPEWLRHYRRENLMPDMVAGLMVSVLVIPLNLAYAMLAGLPAQAGLVASVLPVLAYAWLGTSMTQAVGPVAITAMVTGSVLGPLAPAGSSLYVGLAASLAFASGALIALAGMLRLGFLAQLLSRPVASGFISGAALLIVFSQVPTIFGVPVPGSRSPVEALWYGLTHLNVAHPEALVLGGAALLVLWLATRRFSGVLVRLGVRQGKADFLVRLMPLLVLAVCASLVYRQGWGGQSVALVSAPSGGSAPWWVWPSVVHLPALLGPTLTVAFIGMVQGIAISQALAARRSERVDANRELLAIGTANLFASVSGGMPVGGGVSRSAVNVAAGAQTPLASMVAAIAMGVMLLLGTGWIGHLPVGVLSACVLVAASSMVDVAALRKAWAYDRADALALLATAGGVVAFGFQAGIVMGIGLSLATLLFRASTPHIAVIGRIPGSEHFRNVERHQVETIPGVLMVRIDESLFFGNLSAVESRLQSELVLAPDTRHLVLIMSAVNRVDTTAMEVLGELNRSLLARDIHLHLAEVKGPVQDRAAASPFFRELSGRVYLSVNDAFNALAKETPVEPVTHDKQAVQASSRLS